MNILVTGGAGYIGDSAVQYLLRLGHRVTVLDNLIYGGAYMRQDSFLTFVRGDIRDPNLIKTLVSTHDGVLHLAAIVGDGACQANPKLTVEVNEQATATIARLCKEHDKSMTFASTCSVYGANNNLLVENSPTNPLSLYAGTKLKAEEYVKEVPRHYIFRLGTLLGLSAEHARLRCDLVANILTYRAMSNETLQVFGGEQWRPLLHVRDAGELMAYSLTRKPLRQSYPKGGYGTYILSRRNYTMLSLASLVLDVCGKSRSKMEVTEMPYEDQRNYKVSESRHGKFWLPSRSVADGIAEMARTVREGRIADLWSAAHHNARYARETF
jgi:nucleoside-diphosphate-sugar epimerase